MPDRDRGPAPGRDRDVAIRRAHDQIGASSSESGPYLPHAGRSPDQAWSRRRVVNLVVALLIIVCLGAIAVWSIATTGDGPDDAPVPPAPATTPVVRT